MPGRQGKVHASGANNKELARKTKIAETLERLKGAA
jgi:hypothetical protein